MMNWMHAIAASALAQAQDAADAPKPAAAGKSLFEYIHSGGILSYVLVCVSVVALGLIIANLILLRRERMAPRHVVGGLERLLKDRNVNEAVRFCAEAENDSFLARMMGSGLQKAQRLPMGMLEVRSALEEAGARELDRLERVTQGIGICASIGPMLGLLGTVIGMIGAFATIGKLEGASRSTELAGFMSIALITTAEGLIVAIPCTIAFALFKRQLDRLVADMGEIAERLVVPVMAAGAAPAAAAVPAAPRPAARPPAPGPAAVAPARGPGGGQS